MAFKFPLGEKVHCLELSSGLSTTGFIKIMDAKIETELFCYEKHFFLQQKNPIYMKTENCNFISLYGGYIESAGARYSDDDHLTVYCNKIYANIAIIGRYKWTWEHKVKISRFTTPYLKEMFEGTKEYKKIANNNSKIWISSQIFTVSAGSIKIRGGCVPIYQGFDDLPKLIKPYLEIEFPKGVDLKEQYIANDYLSSFWSFFLGYPVIPEDVHVSDLTRAGLTKANRKSFEESTAVKEYCPIFYSRFERHPPETDLSPVYRLFHRTQKFSEIKNCLRDWMLRQTIWEPASHLMLDSLYYSNEFSAERLLAACRWFEAIPNNNSSQSITDDDIVKIANAATTKARELGYPSEINQRVKGSIKNIRNETHEEKFTRLYLKIAEKFGEKLPTKQFVTDLGYAMKYRNRVAHGTFKINSNQESLDSQRGMIAMEILCTLLTLYDLPLGENFINNFDIDRRIQEYRRMYTTASI